jgi:hypothetical protein
MKRLSLVDTVPLPPKILEPTQCQLSIAHRVLNVSCDRDSPAVTAYRAPRIGQGEGTGMPQQQQPAENVDVSFPAISV